MAVSELPADRDGRGHEHVEIFDARAMVRDRNTNGEAPLAADGEHGGRRHGNPALLQRYNDFLIEAIEARGIEARFDVAEADDVERHGRDELEFGRVGALSGIGHRLSGELKVADSAAAVVIEGMALELLGRAHRLVAGHSPPRHGAAPRWLLAVRDELDATALATTPSIGRLARVADVHPGHLARAFRSYFGLSVGEYVRALRLDWAGRELRESDQPIGAIALAAGFFDQSHFTRAFRARFGDTPARCRRK